MPTTTSEYPSASGFLAEESVISRFASGGTIPFFGKNLRAEGTVLKSPDSGFSLTDDNGTVIVSYAAALAIPEITTLSRANFSILAKTRSEASADALAAELKTAVSGSGVRVRSFRGGSGGATRIVDDVTAYVSEALAVVFFLAGTAAFFFSKAVWISNRRYFSVLRILGASRFSVSAAFVTFFLIAAVLAAASAFVLSVAVLEFVPIPASLGVPSVGLREMLRLLATFPFVVLPAAVPGVVSVFKTPPLSGLGEPRISLPSLTDGILTLFGTFSASALFLYVLSGLAPWAAVKKSATVILAIAALLLLAFMAIRVSARIFKKIGSGNFALFDSVRLSIAPGSPAFPVVAAFVVPAVLLASFASLAFHFTSELERLSTSGYDIFAMNLTEKDAESARSAFPKSESYSVIRARISKINGLTLAEHLDGEPSREFSREFNVTSSKLPEAVIAGENRDVKIGEVSLDDEFSKSLGISVGDVVTFSVLGREFALTAVNVRESNREGIRPFFYFQVAPGEFSKIPPSYFVAASTPDTDSFKSEVLRRSGSYVSFVDVRESVGIVRSSAARILPAVWAFLAAVAMLSVTVAVAALSSLKGFRTAREKAYSAIGATRVFLRRQALYTLVFYVVSAFAAAAVVAFPAVWGGIASVSFLKFSLTAAFKAIGVLFGFLFLAAASVAAFERK